MAASKSLLLDFDDDAGGSGDDTIANSQGLQSKDSVHINTSNGGVDDLHVNKQHVKNRNDYYSDQNVDPSLLEPLLDDSEPDMPKIEYKAASEISACRKYLAVFVLFLINLLNYMDRFTIAGVLLPIQEFFGVDNASVGLLQTVFIVSYMLVAPVFGYLGDRYNRKILMLVGMVIWSGCTLGASFVDNKSQFPLFLALRGLVGIGEASYSTLAPTIIADLFVKSKRTRMLSVFFFAVPVGSGLGYIVGSQAASLGGSWHWALRVTPGLGVVTMVLMVILIPNTRRGAAETNEEVATKKGIDKNRSSYLEDLKYVFTNPTFMWVTIGFTFMAFVVGSLTLWGPVFVAYSQIVVKKLQPCTSDDCEYAGISFIFGLITCVAGFAGVWIGAESAKKWKDYGNKDADAHVCAIGLICAAPCLYGGFHLAAVNINAAWALIFFADMFLCLTWTLVGDMTLYVTLPMRRSTAQAVQVLTMHLFGDAGSPYLIGVISDALAETMPDTYYTKYISLQRSIYSTLFAAVLGGAGFLFAAIFLQRDKKKVDDFLRGEDLLYSSSSSEASSSYSRDLTCGVVQDGSAIKHANIGTEVRAVEDGPTLAFNETDPYSALASNRDVIQPKCRNDVRWLEQGDDVTAKLLDSNTPSA